MNTINRDEQVNNILETGELTNIAIHIEKLHRYVFDNMYLQAHERNDDYTQKEIELKNRYFKLSEEVPNWRSICKSICKKGAYVRYTDI